jgi:hypothetical protein
MSEIRLELREADSHLPAVCMCCGNPATSVTTTKILWRPAWLDLLFPFNPVAWFFLTLLLEKQTHLQAPFCAVHRDYWFRRSFRLGVSGVLVAVIVFLLCASVRWLELSHDAFWTTYLCSVSLVFAWLVALAIVRKTGIRARVITDNEIVLKCVAEEFVAALQKRDWQQFQCNQETLEDLSVPVSQVKSDAIQNKSEPPPDGPSETLQRSSVSLDAFQE